MYDKIPGADDTIERTLGETEVAEVDGAVVVTVTEPDWLAMAKQAFADSTELLDQGVRARIERNYALAKGEHPVGSKYHHEAFAKRNKVFRGKTASAIEQKQAAFDVAMFSNQDAVHVSAENADIKEQVESAELLNDLMGYYLELDEVAWFQTAIGAQREAEIVGFCTSLQYWAYDAYEDEAGETVEIANHPVIELIPPENVRIAPGAHWIDPINRAPYVIVLMPMFVADIRERMGKDWLEVSDSELQLAAVGREYDTTDRARAGKEHVPDQDASILDFQQVWVHLNFVRYAGEEWVYYTLADHVLLSDPMLVEEAFPHTKLTRKRPIVFGKNSIEPHRVFCSGLPERVEGAQILANEITNQRLDNVALVLNKRYLARRGLELDYQALTRSVPGGIVLSNDISDAALRPLEFRDVTGSSYQEQNLVNNDFDEIAGTFSQSSVATSRALNETVGGMNMLRGNSNAVTEHRLRIFVETWAQPVLREVAAMVQTYTPNETIQAICGPEFNVGHLQSNVKSRVNVGFGATDPQKRVEKLAFGLGAIAKFVPNAMADADAREIVAEIFGALGWKDGDRFFPRDVAEAASPMVKQLQAKLQELQKIIETEQIKMQGQLQIEQVKQAGLDKREIASIQAEIAALQAKLSQERQLTIMQAAIDREDSLAETRSELGIRAEELNLDRLKEMNRQLETMNAQRELSYKMKTGNEGI